MSKVEEIIKFSKKIHQSKLLKIILEKSDENTAELLNFVESLSIEERMDVLGKLTGGVHIIKAYVPTGTENIKCLIRSDSSLHELYPGKQYNFFFAICAESVKIKFNNGKLKCSWETVITHTDCTTELFSHMEKDIAGTHFKNSEMLYEDMRQYVVKNFGAEINRFTLKNPKDILTSPDKATDILNLIPKLEPLINKRHNNELRNQLANVLTKIKAGKILDYRSADIFRQLYVTCYTFNEIIETAEETVYVISIYDEVLLVKKDNEYSIQNLSYPAFQRHQLAKKLML